MNVLPGTPLLIYKKCNQCPYQFFVLSQTTYVNVAVFRVPDEEGINFIIDPRGVQSSG